MKIMKKPMKKLEMFMKKFFTTSCILLCLLGQAQVCEGVEDGGEKVIPEKSLLDQCWDILADLKKLWHQKTDDAFSNLKENFAPTKKDNKTLNTIKKGFQQNTAPLVNGVKTVADTAAKIVIAAPIKIMANGLPQDPDDVVQKNRREESDRLLKRLKPYCPDGEPKALIKLIDDETAHQKKIELCKKEKDAFTKEILDLQTTIARGQTAYRSPGKTALLVVGSLVSGASIGAFTYYLLNFLSPHGHCTKRIKRCKKQIKNLNAGCQALSKKVKAVRAALKKDELDDATRAKGEEFLEKNIPLLKKRRAKIASAKRTLLVLRTKLIVQAVSFPLISLATAIGAVKASLTVGSQLCPESTPPQISIPPENLTKLKNSLAEEDKKHKKESENLEKLEQIKKDMPYISQSAKISLAEWQQSMEQEDRKIAESANAVINTYANQLNNSGL